MIDPLVPLPWLTSRYDPYWWRHYGTECVQPQPPLPPTSCTHNGPLEGTRCCVNHPPTLAPAPAPAPCTPNGPVEETRCCLNHPPTLARAPCTHNGPPYDTKCCLSPLVGQTVLARRVEDGHFHLGHVKQELSRDRFLVLFDRSTRGKSRSASLQEVWIFDIIAYAEAFRHPIVPGDKVLVHNGSGRYIPAAIVQGSERRYGDRSLPSTDLLIKHADGAMEQLPQGVAVWIPPNIHDRLIYELQLPFTTRRSLADCKRLPETVMACTEGGECCGECNSKPLCGEECQHIQTGNPYQCSNYYRKLYESWPWWWKYWYQEIPPPWMAGKTFPSSPPRLRPTHHAIPAPAPHQQPISYSPPPQPRWCPTAAHNYSPPPKRGFQPSGPIGIARSRSASNMIRSTAFTYGEDFGDNCQATNDGLNRRVAQQIAEHSDWNRMMSTPNEYEQMMPQCGESYDKQNFKMERQTVNKFVKSWKPQTRWMPTSKNRYGMNRRTITNYVQQDKALSEWENRGRRPPVPEAIQQTVTFHDQCFDNEGRPPASNVYQQGRAMTAWDSRGSRPPIPEAVQHQISYQDHHSNAIDYEARPATSDVRGFDNYHRCHCGRC